MNDRAGATPPEHTLANIVHMAETEIAATAPLETPFEPLRWIGAYKIFKAVLALIAGLMVLRLMHRDLPAVAVRWMHRLHIEAHSEVGKLILHRVVMIKARSLGWLAIGLFAYVPLAVAEGWGLIFRKIWAEWLTVVTTAALIPVEIREVITRFTWPRLTLFILNVAVVIYLLIRLRRDRHRH